MTTGKRFRIIRSTLALVSIGGKRTIVMVPTDSIVTVLPEFTQDSGLVGVLWEGRVVEMFAIDLAVRGLEVGSKAATA